MVLYGDVRVIVIAVSDYYYYGIFYFLY